MKDLDQELNQAASIGDREKLHILLSDPDILVDFQDAVQ
jgi:hypothetical protein